MTPDPKSGPFPIRLHSDKVRGTEQMRQADHCPTPRRTYSQQGNYRTKCARTLPKQDDVLGVAVAGKSTCTKCNTRSRRTQVFSQRKSPCRSRDYLQQCSQKWSEGSPNRRRSNRIPGPASDNHARLSGTGSIHIKRLRPRSSTTPGTTSVPHLGQGTVFTTKTIPETV